MPSDLPRSVLRFFKERRERKVQNGRGRRVMATPPVCGGPCIFAEMAMLWTQCFPSHGLVSPPWHRVPGSDLRPEGATLHRAGAEHMHPRQPHQHPPAPTCAHPHTVCWALGPSQPGSDSSQCGRQDTVRLTWL